MIPKSAVVALGKTELQHGRGGPGEQAAHKIIAALSISGRSMVDCCGADHALRMFLVFLLSETTVLPRCYNMADQELEDAGLRDECVVLAQQIVSRDYVGPSPLFVKFKSCMLNIYTALHSQYVELCRIHQRWVLEAFRAHHAELEELKLKRTESNKQFFDPQIEKKKINCSDDLFELIALDVYLEVAETLAFPLLDSELANVYEMVMGVRPF